MNTIHTCREESSAWRGELLSLDQLLEACENKVNSGKVNTGEEYAPGAVFQPKLGVLETHEPEYQGKSNREGDHPFGKRTKKDRKGGGGHGADLASELIESERCLNQKRRNLGRVGEESREKQQEQNRRSFASIGCRKTLRVFGGLKVKVEKGRTGTGTGTCLVSKSSKHRTKESKPGHL